MDLATTSSIDQNPRDHALGGVISGQGSYTAPGFSLDGLGAHTSDYAQEESSGPSPHASSGSIRAKTGCITCRLRKKKRCDEGKPKCAACDRLGIECLGYGAKRPKWLRDESNAKRAKLEIKEKVSKKRASKAKQGGRSQPQEDVTVSGWSAAPAIEVSTSSIWEIGSDDARTWEPGFASQSSGTTSNLFDATSAALTTSAPTATSPPFMNTPPFNLDPELDDVWRMLFGQPDQSQWQDQIVHSLTPGPSAGPSTSFPNQNYLHHYLNVVLPLQYRFTGSLSIGELVAPLAIAKTEVLTSVSSLAALHMSVKRNKAIDPTTFLNALSLPDDDAMVAVSSHQSSIERLRFISSSDFTAEDIILSAMFAVSYHTFMGGTSKEWKEVLAISQRCLSAALASSPELTGGRANPSVPSPWQRYRQLVEVMIWMDIIASVSQNRVSRLLPTYRNLLGHLPVMSLSHPKLSMERVMGGDSTTLLALAETVALSEWKERAEEAGYSNAEQLKQRSAPIAKLLSERAWREAHFDEAPVPILLPDGTIRTESDEEGKMRVMSDVFYGAANLFLASVIHGPYPRVAEIAAAVQDIIEALHRLDILQSNPDINRALIFPITLAGCLCETPSQQAFFRSRFQQLSPEASAFGNTRPALELMEEVWLRRALGNRESKVDWRAVMLEKWEAGILLI